MNGFAAHGLNEDAFGEKTAGSEEGGLRTFDAFPKTKASYTAPSSRGGQWTVIVLAICTFLSFTEIRTWMQGTEMHHFSVEKGVSHELQLNLDMVVDMPCDTLRVNIQDAAGDRILAGEMLTKEDTSWKLWMDKRNTDTYGGSHEYQKLNQEDSGRLAAQEEDAHAHHVMGEVRRNPRRKFPKSPKLRRGEKKDSCRIYGSLEGNKVQGDFHITARGHGYAELGAHLDHQAFNFSHMITELSFGPHYPSLLNPLDKTIASTEDHYYKFQYFLSVVPTIYSKGQGALDTYSAAPPSAQTNRNKNIVFTNQYAATTQSGALPENPFYVPGIYFKYNIEPILLLVSEERGSLLALLIRLINTASGVLVTGGWVYQFSGWVGGILGRRRRAKQEGVLNGRPYSDD
ncbi:hypothetical protein ASPZODRAFT_104636 [Penicilliopsis zonata CBS 506.65]|uniref:Endoplasmic reticulum-Golgi intermediate compartment protein n=1 Tax=Penicilliopsis zonata CBS 506.65 TaxID=1073090 RepID=A0A1L9S6S0_9EURO|nr:hypothetical protein ASPZODRAFT_104636 [Penicilliopsis zonata CBS 506.65]OJJ42877.1 hypothetical protein ASPZODRAFT_104636 [Penicilliopsis zonata CBS 506.65]